MSERSRVVLANISHYGGLSVFFSFYISFCYALTVTVMTTSLRPSAQPESPIASLPVVNAIEIATARTTTTSPALTPISEESELRQDTKPTISTPPVVIDSPVAPPQTPPASSRLENLLQPALTLMKDQQLSLQKLLSSL